ncbi:MAG: sulfite exporter TauE/SafE family protein [Candidatus Electrothrix sp. GW3-4]|uniref:HoxN/HupN/NixA family nickel/cobalt transporter n=1 Tax=Candidatus Electrothrix sp. GW3-4 TaxID=3126740 RepID=UPI0030D36F8E
MTDLVMLYSGAITLGALHAFEPGHGKTLIAAYMIGTKGRAWDGMLLGAIVTITHTFSVILLGLVAQILSHTYSEETLHNWLGLFSAGIILAVGIWMLRQRLSGKSGHTHIHLFGKGHSHDHHHPHSHPHTHDEEHNHHDHAVDNQGHTHEHLHPHVHPHVHDGYHAHSHQSDEHPEAKHTHHTKVTAKNNTKKNPWELFMLGISGGIIPCPAAIATLLAAIAAGKIAQGLSVTLFFSLGLGVVMMTIGVLLSQTGRLTNKISENFDFARRLGIVSALLIVSIGSYTMFHSVRSIWF